MTANEYQRQRAEDNGDVPFEEARVLYSLGIAGEAGEVADYMKKVIGHGKEFDRTKLVDELGDVLWYVSQLAHIHDIPLEEIMTMNTAKLRMRYPHGFKGDLPHWMERKKGGDDGTPTEQLIEQLGKTIERLQQDKEQIAKEAWELKEAYDTLRAELEELRKECDQWQYKAETAKQLHLDVRAERDELSESRRIAADRVIELLDEKTVLMNQRDELVRVLEALSKFGNPYDGPSKEELTLWGRAHELITCIKGETT
jgi:NTP pyrophosphatase (non-canonical NTP hydrolase)